MKLLARLPVIAVPILMALLHSSGANANNLYQWTGSDGTPTYSPDPPPKGVPFTMVGPDLKPIQSQAQSAPTDQQTPQATAGSQNPMVTTRKSNLVMTPDPSSGTEAPNSVAKPKPSWKPVKYADDPNPDDAGPVFKNKTVTAASISPPVNRITGECLTIKQRQLVLESQFANAQTATEMDQAVLRLSAFQKQNKGQCGIR